MRVTSRHLRVRLVTGFARVGSEGAREGARVLKTLAAEHDAVAELLPRVVARTPTTLPTYLPDLAEDTYVHGISALADALELLEFADGPQRQRLQDELDEVEARLDRSHVDDRTRSRDEDRRASHRRLLARHDQARQRAHDLVFEAERCTTALAETRVELASVRADDTEIDADGVVQTLQDTIQRVRDVQDAMRMLGE